MKKLRYFVRLSAFSALSAIVCALFFSPSVRAVLTMPEVMYINQQQVFGLEEQNIRVIGNAVEARQSGDESLTLTAVEKGSSTAVLSILGVPVRTVELRVASDYTLIPGGQAVGIQMFTKGVLIVGLCQVETQQGKERSPADEAGLMSGDIILTVDGTEVNDSTHLGKLVDAGSEQVKLLIDRNGKTFTVQVRPLIDVSDNSRKIGIWARDSTAGVGTITYYDPSNNYYGALGHPITDVDTGGVLSVKEGKIVGADIVGVVKGASGAPGELKGVFVGSDSLGTIKTNCEYGVFGKINVLTQNKLYPEGVEIAVRNQVHVGDAQIICTLDGTGIKSYDAKIVRISTQSSPAPRGLVIQITDPELLKITGGIVQGMSGSPIIQDGRIVGAVTHVFVNDPSKGYGMYIEWMLEKQEDLYADAVA